MFVKNWSYRFLYILYFWYTIIVDVEIYYQYFFIYENFALYFRVECKDNISSYIASTKYVPCIVDGL